MKSVNDGFAGLLWQIALLIKEMRASYKLQKSLRTVISIPRLNSPKKTNLYWCSCYKYWYRGTYLNTKEHISILLMFWGILINVITLII